MDKHDRIFDAITQFKLFKRIQELQKTIKSRIRQPSYLGFFKRRQIGILLACAALLMGLWANTLTSEMAVLEWQKEHQPHVELVHGILKQLGFFEIKQEDHFYRKLSETLTNELKEGHSTNHYLGFFWIEKKCACVVYSIPEHFSNEYELSDLFYCFDSLKMKKAYLQSPVNHLESEQTGALQWFPLGQGWLGLEELIIEAGEMRKSVFRAKKRIKPQYWRDPRRIHF